MYARVTTLHLQVKSMEEAIKVYEESIIPEAEKQEGFKNAFFLSNRNAGKFVLITIWKNVDFALKTKKKITVKVGPNNVHDILDSLENH